MVADLGFVYFDLHGDSVKFPSAQAEPGRQLNDTT